MRYILSIIVTVAFFATAQAQIRPDQTPTKSPEGTDAIYTQENGTLNKILLDSAFFYFIPRISTDTLGYALSTTAANPDSLRGLLIRDSTNALHYVDSSGVAVLFASESIIDSTRLTQDSIIVYFQDGSEIGRDTILTSDAQQISIDSTGRIFTIALQNGGSVAFQDQTYDDTALSDSIAIAFDSLTVHRTEIIESRTDIAALFVDSTRLLQDSILAYYQGGSEVGRDTLKLATPETDPIYAADSAQLKADIAANSGLTLQQVTDNGNSTTNDINIGGSSFNVAGINIGIVDDYSDILGTAASIIWTSDKGTGLETYPFDGYGHLVLAARPSATRDIVFATHNGGNSLATRVVIKHSTGNLGIGKTTPAHKLDVSGTGRFTDRLYLGTIDQDNTNTSLLAADPITGEVEEVAITNPTGGTNTLQASLDNLNESTTVLTDSTKNSNANFSTIFDATTSTEALLSIVVTTSNAIVTLPNPSASLVGHKIKLFNFTSSNSTTYTVSSGNFWISGVYVSSYSVPTDGRIDNLTCIYSPENGTYVWAVESN